MPAPLCCAGTYRAPPLRALSRQVAPCLHCQIVSCLIGFCPNQSCFYTPALLLRSTSRHSAPVQNKSGLACYAILRLAQSCCASSGLISPRLHRQAKACASGSRLTLPHLLCHVVLGRANRVVPRPSLPALLRPALPRRNVSRRSTPRLHCQVISCSVALSLVRPGIVAPARHCLVRSNLTTLRLLERGVACPITRLCVGGRLACVCVGRFFRVWLFPVCSGLFQRNLRPPPT